MFLIKSIIIQYRQQMENIKQLNNLIEQATTDALSQPSLHQFNTILTLVNSRMDMPKHCIAAISKRIGVKNKKVLLWSFHLLQFISYNTELSLYSQISTKEFLFKISGLLMDKNIDQQVSMQILSTIKCLDELFRPHEDLLPLFYQFYAGVLKKGFPVPHDYVSPYRPKQLKTYQKKTTSTFNQASQNRPIKTQAKVSTNQIKTFEEIRQKIILTNEIIDNANVQEGVKGNALLIQMMEEIKQCEKKINNAINENPNQRIMEMALAANDDLFITYRRYKDLQRNKKPQPFILAQLASDQAKDTKKVQRQNIQPNKPPPKIDKVQKVIKKQEINILDLDYPEPKKSEVKSQISQSNLFDLIGAEQQKFQKQKSQSEASTKIEDLLKGPAYKELYYNAPQIQQINNNFGGFNLGPSQSQFKTEADLKPYDNTYELTNLSNFREFLGSNNNKK